jgi:hypothetical protein
VICIGFASFAPDPRTGPEEEMNARSHTDRARDFGARSSALHQCFD